MPTGIRRIALQVLSAERPGEHCDVFDVEPDDSVYRWIERSGPPAHKNGRLWKLELIKVDSMRAQDANVHDDDAPESAR